MRAHVEDGRIIMNNLFMVSKEKMKLVETEFMF